MPGPAERWRLAKADWMQAGGVAAALFALYAATTPRSVTLEDDALFILSSYFLGVEHPPGYPLFTLFGHLFTYLPFGSVAYRVHLVAALFGALTGAAAWICARMLCPDRLPAYLAAFALGVSPVFWSQSIIADVYSLNTFFFLVLVILGLRACPPGAQPAQGAEQRRLLAWMAAVFGLSLSNHWPLMLLVAPAFLILLWPLRAELLRRAPVLALLVVVGLLPYAWMIWRSWLFLPIGFAGPLETLPEIWLFLSRAGYAEIDHSLAADWVDRVKFFRFLGGQLLLQFALVGTVLAGAGFALQWRFLGRRVSAFLTLAFLMPSAVLLLLIGFDYSVQSKHVFHVYPLPAYAVGALWLGLGFAWLAQRHAVRPAHAAAGAALVLALIGAVGARTNLLAGSDWVADYADTMLKVLPRDAVLVGQGESDLFPIAYFHMIEERRPDLTLYQAKGLILGNRLFHPLRTVPETQKRLLREMVDQQSGAVAFTPLALDRFVPYGQLDRWLYVEVDKSSADPKHLTVDIPEEALRFFERSLARIDSTNDWIANVQGNLRLRYAALLARSLPRGHPPTERQRRHLELLSEDFHGALGIAAGMIGRKDGYSLGAVGAMLDRARELMPSDAAKSHQAHFFYLRGIVRADTKDRAGAVRDFETAVALSPLPGSPSIARLEELYREAGDERALRAIQERFKRVKSNAPAQ
jgi:hypothetical protein